MPKEIILPNEFAPRGYQIRAMRYFDCGGKRAITIWHRRAGKDLTALHQTCKMAHKPGAIGTYWHIFPTSEEARRAIWTGFTKDGKRILEQVFPAAIRKSPREFHPKAEMVVELKCGSIWRMIGSDKMSLVGAGPKGVVFSEYALARPNTWDLVRPMLRESDGWSWFISTPRGANHAKKLFDSATPENGWFRDIRTVHDTCLTYASNRKAGTYISAEEMMEEERLEGMPEELIAQEYLCDWSAANVGSYYGALLAKLDAVGATKAIFSLSDTQGITKDVFTSWDLGRSDDTSIWWWRHGKNGGVDVLDHYSQNGEDLDHYFNVLDERAKEHGWRYRKHILPHDARAKTLATKMSVLEQFVQRYGVGAVDIADELSLLDGIQAVRWLLQRDTRFHVRCSLQANPRDLDGIEALRAYHRDWDPQNKCFRQTPVHDWSSHTADSFRYLAIAARKASGYIPPEPRPPLARVEAVEPTLNELYSIPVQAPRPKRV